MICYTLTSNLTVRKISDEFFILDRATGTVHTFNDTGGFIWEQVYNGTNFESIVEALHLSYGIDLKIAKEDVFDFFSRLEKAGLLVINE